MRKIIEGKLYDTDTADEVCSSEYSNRSDFHYCCETLYRTKKGAWFILGEGGPLSKYAVNDGDNGTRGGETIRVIDDAEAGRFIEGNADAGTYMDYFDAVEA